MPDTIAHYRVVSKLGEGGMGVVYAATDERLQRPSPSRWCVDTCDQQSRERLWREARAAASVSHPNVCQLYEVGEANGELFIAMELLEGEPLSARLARGPIPLLESVDITLAVLSALEAIHARGIVHRDLKPSNIFLTAHGSSCSTSVWPAGCRRWRADAGRRDHGGHRHGHAALHVAGAAHWQPVGWTLRSVRGRRHTFRTGRGQGRVSRRDPRPGVPRRHVRASSRRSMDRRRWPPSTGSCIGQLARSRQTATPSPPPWRRSFVPPGIWVTPESRQSRAE